MHNSEVITTAPSLQEKHYRLWEIDALRGMAIVMMVIYHLMYDLYYFEITDVVFTNRFWFYFQRATAGTFLVLTGISLTLNVDAMRRCTNTETTIKTRLFRRGLNILGCGLIVTAGTWLVFGNELAVKFGILHFIGVATLLVYPFLALRWTNFVLWIGLSLLGRQLQGITIDSAWLLWLGVEPTNHSYVDYFPLIPWFGVMLLGVFLGNTLYGKGERNYPLTISSLPFTYLQWLGKHSLIIYLLHQPLLFVLLTLLIEF